MPATKTAIIKNVHIFTLPYKIHAEKSCLPVRHTLTVTVSQFCPNTQGNC